jgi:hypothetical protein
MPKAVAGTPSGRKTHGKNAPEASADSVVITSSNSDVQTSDIDKALNSLQDQLQRVDELCIPSETKAQVKCIIFCSVLLFFFALNLS